ncbi:MAG: adenylate/guanylate cyclase domain-containing protein [Solirubrobacterales bacterium]
MERPETRYAKSGDLRIAYQVIGDGPLDVVLVPALASNVEISWDIPFFSEFLSRIASFSRLIHFDRRGNGMSDGLAGETPLEEQVDDVLAVLKDAGAEEPALISMLEGCSLATLFSATYPEMVRAQVMLVPNPRPVAGPGYEWAPSVEERNIRVEAMVENWGSDAEDNRFIVRPEEAEQRRNWNRWQRLAMGPAGLAKSLAIHGETDVRDLLPSIQCPTLVIRPEADAEYDERHSRYVAEHIPNACYVETPGTGPLWTGAVDAVADEIQLFLTGAKPPVNTDRVLATVLFTDIVGSTERAAALGDGAWRSLLERHDNMVKDQVERHRGRFIKSLGDGALALFDGPSRAISSATEISSRAEDLDLEVRAGLHTGECELLSDGDVGGMAVHIGSRVSSLAGPGEVLVSSTVRDLVVGSGQTLTDHGEHELKGVPGPWRIFAVET